MPALALTIVAVVEPFAVRFTRPSWAHAQVLVIGTLLAQGPRTVTAALRRLLGRGQAPDLERDRFRHLSARAAPRPISPQRLERLLDQLAATA